MIKKCLHSCFKTILPKDEGKWVCKIQTVQVPEFHLECAFSHSHTPEFRMGEVEGSVSQRLPERLSQLPDQASGWTLTVKSGSFPSLAEWRQPTAGFSPLLAENRSQNCRTSCSLVIHRRCIAKIALAIVLL